MVYESIKVQSAWLSKINLVSAVTALLALATAFGLPVDDATKVQILSIAGVASPVIIMLLRSYFTTTITPASAARVP